MRDKYGALSTIFKYFVINDHEEFYKFLKMNVEQFMQLDMLLENRLIKRSRRSSLPPSLRIVAVICLMAHGSDTACISWLFRISKEILYRMILEVCTVIGEILMPIYVKFPCKQRWQDIGKDYWTQWQFPNCVGALDGKHISIQLPPNGGSLFYNYKKFHSFVLLALCESNYLFTWFNLGDYGSNSDESIFINTDLHYKMMNNELNVPSSQPLPHTDISLPYAFIGDEIFPLHNHLLKPYSRRQLSIEERVFNYRLKRARLTIECAFGIRTSKWAIIQKRLKFDLLLSKRITAACICLHNFLIFWKLGKNPNDQYQNNEHHINHENIANERIDPIMQRNLLTQYFSAPVGAVPWQLSSI